jgi:hypothetical protein
MTGEQVGARSPSPTRKASSEPPGFDRVAGAFRRSGRWHIAFAVVALLCALALAAAWLLGVGGPEGTTILFSAGGFVLALALFLLLQGWRRLMRVRFLASVRNRWVQLARAGDPDDQIATLRRAYSGLIGNDIRARVAPSR